LFPLNPGGIIPAGPDLSNLLQPHDRARLTHLNAAIPRPF
jgi:putative glutathione S-transferase